MARKKAVPEVQLSDGAHWASIHHDALLVIEHTLRENYMGAEFVVNKRWEGVTGSGGSVSLLIVPDATQSLWCSVDINCGNTNHRIDLYNVRNIENYGYVEMSSATTMLEHCKNTYNDGADYDFDARTMAASFYNGVGVNTGGANCSPLLQTISRSGAGQFVGQAEHSDWIFGAGSSYLLQIVKTADAAADICVTLHCTEGTWTAENI